ncbi:MAG: hypothetical protein IIC09_06865 [Proteobacteria bacterium]|nr:hypothetical protein [Pseudomonadota bacterium]
MRRVISKRVAPAFKQLHRRFAAWREAGRMGRKIPEELWEAATELARKLGVNPVSKAIGLDYTQLKRRVVGNSQQQIATNATGGFVEFAVDPMPATPKCMIEFEGQRGKLTIQLTGHQPSEVVTLADTLAKSER